MKKTREELDAQLLVLTAELLESEKITESYRSQAAATKRQLEDVNKPELTEDQYAHLCDAINDALRELILKTQAITILILVLTTAIKS